jgi:hypothetical protein
LTGEGAMATSFSCTHSCGKDSVGETPGDEDAELSEGYAWMAGLGSKDGAGLQVTRWDDV